MLYEGDLPGFRCLFVSLEIIGYKTIKVQSLDKSGMLLTPIIYYHIHFDYSYELKRSYLDQTELTLLIPSACTSSIQF